MIDFGVGWRAVPGKFSLEDGVTAQIAAARAPADTAVVELGAWCGRSLAAFCEVLPTGVAMYSYDNYLDGSQADVPGASPFTPAVAKRVRTFVEEHFKALGCDVRCAVQEASMAGREYAGPPISVLFVDDHHSAEQLTRNFEAWLPHLAPQSTVLLHDYAHQPYQLDVTAVRVLPALGYGFVGIRAGSGIGIWSRGYR